MLYIRNLSSTVLPTHLPEKRISYPSDDLLDSYSQPYSMRIPYLPSPDKKASPTRGRRNPSFSLLFIEGKSCFFFSRDGSKENDFHSKGSDSKPLLAAFFQTFPSVVHSIGAVAVLALSLVAGDLIRLASSLPSSVIVPVVEEARR